MTIKVQVENPVDARLKLRARKTLDGNILILDHPEIDIVLSPKNKKKEPPRFLTRVPNVE